MFGRPLSPSEDVQDIEPHGLVGRRPTLNMLLPSIVQRIIHRMVGQFSVANWTPFEDESHH